MMNEVTRYAEFCQFRREIRGSNEHVIVGIDVAKERHRVFIGTARGRSLLRRLNIDNNRTGFERLIERTDQNSASAWSYKSGVGSGADRQLSQAAGPLAAKP